MKPNKMDNGKTTPPQLPPKRPEQSLRFTPYAWAKLNWFLHRGETEVGGFGITSGGDLLLVEDFVTIKQEVSFASVSFDDGAVADFFDQQVDQDLKLEQFARIWLHTHPGDCPNPSGTDEQTFRRVFGGCDWAVMFILAKGGQTYARLRFNIGPGGECLLPVELDCSCDFPASDLDAWEMEYLTNVHPVLLATTPKSWRDLELDPRWMQQIDSLPGAGARPPEEWDELELNAMAQDPELYDPLFEQEDEVTHDPKQ